MISVFTADVYLLFRQKRTYYGIAATLIIVLFIMLGSWYQGKQIIETLLEGLTKNFLVQGNLLNGNLVMYLVLNSLWFNLPLIIMIVVSGLLTNEYRDRTLQTVLLQAVDKKTYVVSKFFTGVLFTLVLIIVLFIFSTLLAYTLFGQGDLITYLGGLNFYETEDAFQRIAGAFLSGTNLMIFYATLSMTVAVIFKEMTVTWIVSALLLIITNLLLKVDFGVMNGWLFPKISDTWQYHFYSEIPQQLIHSNNALIFAYTLVIAMIGILIFNTRDIG